MKFEPLRAWKLGLSTSQGIPSPKLNYEVDAYMTTIFGGEARGLSWESGLADSGRTGS